MLNHIPNTKPKRCDAVSWSIIIPTYQREDTLDLCLKSLAYAIQDREDIELIILDNGDPKFATSTIKKYSEALPIQYVQNTPGQGLGYSLTRGLDLAKGELILELNDDALVPAEIFRQLEDLFRIDQAIGVIGLRAIEKDYAVSGNSIGIIDSKTCGITANFTTRTDDIIDVDHIYGFCFAYRRKLKHEGIAHDQVLLAKNYSSGSRIETDQCLSAKRRGYRVVYAGNIGVQHLAKPRSDIDERSAKWRVNYLRNTLYLFLKHFGLTGKKFIALRFAITHDLGIRSAILSPSLDNVTYAAIGLYAKLSALYHWIVLLVSFNQKRKS